MVGTDIFCFKYQLPFIEGHVPDIVLKALLPVLGVEFFQ